MISSYFKMQLYVPPLIDFKGLFLASQKKAIVAPQKRRQNCDMTPLGDLRKHKVHSHFHKRKFNKPFFTSKLHKAGGATSHIGLAMSNVCSFLSAENAKDGTSHIPHSDLRRP